MSLTETTPLPLGFIAPDFTLPDVVDDANYSFSQLRGPRGTVVMFICNHCPYVIHIREELLRVARDYLPQGITFIAISSNDVTNYPEDAPAKMRDLATRMDFPFRYLYDESQEVARAYDAACTPDFSVFDAESKCVYRGRFDGSTPGNSEPVTGKDLRHCLDFLVEGRPVEMEQLPSMGCNIKWK